MSLFFATKNKGKFREAKLVFESLGLKLTMLGIDKIEIQSDSLEEVASYAARELAERLNLKVIVEDAGLFIRSLNGFPGPYSAYAFKTIGLNGILKLMDSVNDRYAYFLSIVAYAEPEKPVKIFQGKVEGSITYEPRGSEGFGFDPIFQPLKADGKTFAEMTGKEKNRFSHRAEAFRKLALWIRENEPLDHKS
ncbi:XTP/dITP diphosphatase [Candidatus Bathyarchaeota archaeon]|nr:XTP/dITP diphosphatase [Candidatus Bathyarchaeota archaeon]MBS7613467.1 XTP/dITP diphosphatase [Candidatus Bathyarchaeota archaeon]